MVGSVTPSSSSQPGKKDRREAARETARIEREAEKRRTKRNRLFVQGGIGVVVIAIAVIAVMVISGANKPAGPGPLNMASDGILLSGAKLDAVKTGAIKASGKPVATKTVSTAATARIVTYVDYQCPACQAFETTNEAQLATWVKAGAATLEIHPIAILDNSSLGNRYSSRAANAAACVANFQPNNYFAVSTAFYAHQPTEGTSGLSDAKILAILKGAGSSSDNITSCVKDESFGKWVTAATARATSGALPNSNKVTLTGTPTVLVNGASYTGSLTDATAFAAFVSEQTKA